MKALLSWLFGRKPSPTPTTFHRCLALHMHETPNKSGVWSI